MQVRWLLIGAALAIATGACSGGSTGSSSPATATGTGMSAQPPATVTTPPPATVSPTGVPDGTPGSFPDPVDASDLPPAALVPAGATPTDLWPVIVSIGEQYAVVAYDEPGADPLRQARGLVVWRRWGDAEPWRPVLGVADPAHAGVVQIRATVGDVTGDGSPDVLTFAETGGSGACGIWRVLDLAANAVVFERNTCDATIDVSTDPPGLAMREAVFAPGDAHCCPSAFKNSVLRYDAATGRWAVDTVSTEPA